MLSSSSPVPAPLWQALLDGDPAQDSAAFHNAWLQTLVQGLGAVGAGVVEAVLVLDGRHLGPAGLAGELRPAAAWPLQQPCTAALAALCEEALAQRTLLQRGLTGGAAMLALPLLQKQELHGVVGLLFASAQAPRHAQDWLRWGLGWLLGAGSAGQAEQDALRERMLLALELMTAVIAEPDWRAACNVAVTEAAHRLGCDRVSLGLAKGERLRLQALSNAADFSARLDLAHALEAAMEEASDQGLALAVSAGQADPAQQLPATAVLREHLALTQGFGTGSALSVPFMLDERRHGVMLFEWPSAEVPALARQMALGLPPLLGRLLLDKRQAQRAWPLRLRDALAAQAAKLFGPRHALRKLMLLALLGLGAFLALATGPYRIAANAALEGGVRRVVAAPFDGFVASSLLRAGQLVKKGQLLATLDDRDLRLESEKWASQQTQYAKQAQEAQAQHSLAQIQISMAQIRQAASQRQLSEAMMARSAIRAPLDGLVVSGDLSQSLGAALKKGQTLFEIAPLDGYRLILQVDEADIDVIVVGQRGELMLTALPGETFPFSITLLTPVAQARDGRNQFRVEAVLELGERQALLRPGMEGIAKVDMGERRLLWIWTHRMGDWLRLQAWQWLGL